MFVYKISLRYIWFQGYSNQITELRMAKKHIPRSFRKEYIPRLKEVSEDLYKRKSECPDTAEELLHSHDAVRISKSVETV